VSAPEFKGQAAQMGQPGGLSVSHWGNRICEARVCFCAGQVIFQNITSQIHFEDRVNMNLSKHENK
jgi:hypothetical protein